VNGATSPAPVDPSSLAAVLRSPPDARTLPAAAYASPEVFDWERRHVFEAS
jgi:Rieske 2Fe-2S family protein